MSWEISANLGRQTRAGVDAHGWLWEITRGAQLAYVLIEISDATWLSDPLRLPDDTRQALETDGRTELLKGARPGRAAPRHPLRLRGLYVLVQRGSSLLAEREHVGPGSRASDLEGAVGDRSRLANHLVKPLLGVDPGLLPDRPGQTWAIVLS
jgi:hypothetical protein